MSGDASLLHATIRDLLSAFLKRDFDACVSFYHFPVLICDSDGQFVLTGPRDARGYVENLRDLADDLGGADIRIVEVSSTDLDGHFATLTILWDVLDDKKTPIRRTRTKYTFRLTPRGPKLICVLALDPTGERGETHPIH